MASHAWLGRTHALRGTVKIFLRSSGYLRQVVKQRGTTALERLEIDRFIVRSALLPTAREEAHPFER
jgi:hypothetical protein